MGPDFRGHNGRKQETDRCAEENDPGAVAKVWSAPALRRFSILSPTHLATGAVALQFGFGIMTVSDSIAAISTPPGEGAIALVRISGANAIEIADKIFRGKESPSRFVSHRQHMGEIVDASAGPIDQAVLSVHRSPASYTG